MNHNPKLKMINNLLNFQGVLQLGPPRAFGSRVPEKDETRICAPVTIGKN
jgi:hypothetical protein